MIVIAFRVSQTEYSVFVALHDENIERIKEHDPADIVMSHITYAGLTLKDVIVGYANDEDLKEITRMYSTDDIDGETVLQFLSRGKRYQPEAGDRDEPYVLARPGEDLKGRAN